MNPSGLWGYQKANIPRAWSWPSGHSPPFNNNTATALDLRSVRKYPSFDLGGQTGGTWWLEFEAKTRNSRRKGREKERKKRTRLPLGVHKIVWVGKSNLFVVYIEGKKVEMPGFVLDESSKVQACPWKDRKPDFQTFRRVNVKRMPSLNRGLMGKSRLVLQGLRKRACRGKTCGLLTLISIWHADRNRHVCVFSGRVEKWEREWLVGFINIKRCCCYWMLQLVVAFALRVLAFLSDCWAFSKRGADTLWFVTLSHFPPFVFLFILPALFLVPSKECSCGWIGG